MLTVEEELVYLHTLEELGMTDMKPDDQNDAPEAKAASVVEHSIAALEQRLTELEQVVHAVVGQNNPHLGPVIAWVEKVGARLKELL